jgi:hypothetical protein
MNRPVLFVPASPNRIPGFPLCFWLAKDFAHFLFKYIIISSSRCLASLALAGALDEGLTHYCSVLTGPVGGVGITFIPRDGSLVVSALRDSSPAAVSGVVQVCQPQLCIRI